MFLFHLSLAERQIFAGLAKHLVIVDGREGPPETAALRRMEAELGLDVVSAAAVAPTPELLGSFASQASKVSVVLELITLAYADGMPHPNEMEMLKDVAAGLGIPELRLLEMEDWVVRQMPLTAQAYAFLTESSS